LYINGLLGTGADAGGWQRSGWLARRDLRRCGALDEGCLVTAAIRGTLNALERPPSLAWMDNSFASLALQGKHGYIARYSTEAGDEQQCAEESHRELSVSLD
jgi:hypothetical protein